MGSKIGITMHGIDEVSNNLRAWDRAKRADLGRVAEQQLKPMLEQHARSNAPWTDQTGNARRGLRGSTEMTATELVLRLSHSVYYGVFLELCNAGQYAILLPTFEATRPQMQHILERFWAE